MRILLTLILISPLMFLGSLYFVNEESLRVLLAFELNRENFFNPTLFGERYLNKPPMFTWLLALFGNLFGFGEFQMRIISVIAFWICTLMVIIYSKNYWSDSKAGIVSGLLFASCGNVLFFYSSIAEIDMLFSMAVLLGIFSLSARKRAFFIFSNLSFAFAMMLKGLAGLSFMPGAFLMLVMRHGPMQGLKRGFFIALFSLSVLGMWLILTKEPLIYAERLIQESFGRVSPEGFSRLSHAMVFPLESFKDMLPASAIVVFALTRAKKVGLEPLLIGVLCYLPYMISDAQGRYVIPVFALFASAFAKSVSDALQDKVFRRAFYLVLIITLSLKIFYAGIYPNFMLSRGDSPKSVAKSLQIFALSKSFSCNCQELKSTCLYLSLGLNKPATKEGDLSIVCQKPENKKAIQLRVRSRTAWLIFKD
ncbi:MAG: glycosyltransferase family 39 protein [Aquificaceae bacterium]